MSGHFGKIGSKSLGGPLELEDMTSCHCVVLCEYLPQEFPLSGTIKGYCIVLYCIVLYCIVLYCIVLYCIVLYCIVVLPNCS